MFLVEIIRIDSGDTFDRIIIILYIGFCVLSTKEYRGSFIFWGRGDHEIIQCASY